MKESKCKCKYEYLSNLIELINRPNIDNEYGLDKVKGINLDKEIIPTKANLSGNDLSKFTIVNPNEFVYNPRTHGKRIGLGINSKDEPFLISWNNTAFRVINSNVLNPYYLYLIFLRSEWDREACYRSWGSSTEVFSWNALCSMQIPLPSIEEQQKVVNAWKALREIKEQNEAIAAPLMQVCQSYIQELKHNYESVEIGEYIEDVNIRNIENKYGVDVLRGVTSEGIFDTSKAKTEGLKFDNYKIVRKGCFAYNPSRINIGSIALCDMEKCIISPMYVIFKLKEESKNSLLPGYLNLWFRRTEFQRSTLFFASGSVRDTFDFSDMQKVRIPLPPIDVQQSIVNLYNCANEAKKIAEEADKKSREICPALIQYVINK